MLNGNGCRSHHLPLAAGPQNSKPSILSVSSAASRAYSAGFKVDDLKDLCKRRKLKRSGAKGVLVKRLEEADNLVRTVLLITSTHLNVPEHRYQTQNNATVDTSHLPDSNLRTSGHPGPHSTGSDTYNNSVAHTQDHALDPAQVSSDVLSLQDSFNHGLNDDDGEDEDDDDADEEGKDDSGDDDSVEDMLTSSTSNNQIVTDAKKWVDEYIFQSRRKSGRNTEASVISQWKVSSNLYFSILHYIV